MSSPSASSSSSSRLRGASPIAVGGSSTCPRNGREGRRDLAIGLAFFTTTATSTVRPRVRRAASFRSAVAIHEPLVPAPLRAAPCSGRNAFSLLHISSIQASRTLQKIHGSVYCLAEVLLPRPRAATPATAMSISSGQASAPHPARPPLRPHACTTAGCPAAVLQLPGRPAPLACALGSLLALLCCGRCISVVHLSSSQLADACIPAVLWLCCCSRRRAASLAMPRLR